jgi:phosphohistidine phosphatase
MDVILFRHGIAVDPQDWEGEEDERPLTVKGRDKTRQAAAGLVRLDLAPTELLTSPLLRAMETAKILREEFQLRTESQRYEELRPESLPEKLFPLLGSFPLDACVICVGHEPHLGALAGIMLFGKPVSGLAFKKAGACCIRFERHPLPGEGSLRWWMTPSQLRMIR